MALTAIRYGAQNSVAIGGTADITGLEAAGGSIENDPNRTTRAQICCAAQPTYRCARLRSPAQGGLGETAWNYGP
jgi:hypothetical protein